MGDRKAIPHKSVLGKKQIVDWNVKERVSQIGKSSLSQTDQNIFQPFPQFRDKKSVANVGNQNVFNIRKRVSTNPDIRNDKFNFWIILGYPYEPIKNIINAGKVAR